ncbi:MAG: hypothetical protein A2Z88_03950 [Omnitrophica WOR_2 bacterium GWA2_47_8]|nr:MAG: hypothetical protein A2Z88_03950 [Omnitrophica WOR_2 bacterium GWA2_47_8]
MNDEQINNLKTDIVAIGRVLWEKDLASGFNGNISARVDAERIVLTGHGTCLGLLQEKDILLMNISGELLEDGRVSTEKLLHTEIYKNFPDAKAVIHTHTTYTNAYFLENDLLSPRVFESKFYLGDVKAVPQNTPAVTDATPVIGQLKTNNITVLKNHGVVAMGKNLFDCFVLIQCLEEAVKVDAISRLYTKDEGRLPVGKAGKTKDDKKEAKVSKPRKYKLFSKEQINEIVRLVNDDKTLKELGEKTNMTMDLAVKLNETGQTYNFQFEKGRIAKVNNSDGAEFLISAPESVWRAVFNREIDPFVATTQKKMNLRGDFAKISKWYAPCSRIFELWTEVPVE